MTTAKAGAWLPALTREGSEAHEPLKEVAQPIAGLKQIATAVTATAQ